MDIFEFSNYTLQKMFFDAFCCSIAMFIFSELGGVFVKNDRNVKALVGISFISLINVVALSFFAVAVKYIIILLFFVSTALCIINRKEMFSLESAKSLLIVIFISLYLTFLYYTNAHSEYYVYNSHEPYFLGPSIEALRAEYFSRLRVLDNYPLIMSKYHFFNTAFISVPLFFIASKTIVSAELAKIVLLSYFIGAAIRLTAQRGKLLNNIFMILFSMALLQTVFANNVHWSIVTNNFSAVGFFALASILFYRKMFLSSIILICVWAATVSRSIVPGFVMAIFVTYVAISEIKSKNENLNFFGAIKELSTKSTVLFAFITALSIIVTIFSGALVEETTPFARAFDTIFNYGWTYLLSPSFLETNLSLFSGDQLIKSSPIYYILMISFIILMCSCRSLIDRASSKHIYALKLYLIVFLLNLVTVYCFILFGGFKS